MAPMMAKPTAEPTAIPTIMPVLDFFSLVLEPVLLELELLAEPELEFDDPVLAVLTGRLCPMDGLLAPGKEYAPVRRSRYEE